MREVCRFRARAVNRQGATGWRCCTVTGLKSTVDQLNRILAALTSFGPAQGAATGAPAAWLPAAQDVPWEEVVAAAERHGLAPIVSHQLEYRFAAKLAPPEWVRERLQNSFHGALNDNVFKLV